MLTQHIALVPESEGVNVSELARVAAALQKQVLRDLWPAWGVLATVDAFPYLEDVPLGYFPVLLTFCDLGRQGGVHLDEMGQPYAQVQIEQHWSLAASRACLEMLVNPFGTRGVGAPSPRQDQGTVELVVEVCGPCGDLRYAYALDGVAVSDFCLPSFFGAGGGSERYSFTGAVTTRMRPLPGGHVTWYDPVSASYWLRSHFAENPIDTRLGASHKTAASVREILNACGPLRVAGDRRGRETLEARMAHAQRASHVHAQRLRALLGSRLEADLGSQGVVNPIPSRPRWDAEADYEQIELEDLDDDELEKTEPSAPQQGMPREVAQAVPAGVARGAAAAAGGRKTASVHATATVTQEPARSSHEAPQAPESRQPLSLRPITLDAVPEPRAQRDRGPAIAALAVAASLGLAWFASRGGLDTASQPRDAGRSAVAAPPVAREPALPAPETAASGMQRPTAVPAGENAPDGIPQAPAKGMGAREDARDSAREDARDSAREDARDSAREDARDSAREDAPNKNENAKERHASEAHAPADERAQASEHGHHRHASESSHAHAKDTEPAHAQPAANHEPPPAPGASAIEDLIESRR